MNRLAGSTSPYLRQHRDNPVDWYPWGPEAFADAVAADRPILLSVGYSACHWCHVMAHESFEDPEVAAVMNRLFVNVKVDREERPDVDAVYMDAVQAMTGRGGWPMTVFLTPDGKPFFGGTYFPRQQFLQLLTAIDEAWRTKRSELQGNVAALMKAISATTDLKPAKEVPGIGHVNAVLKALGTSFDTTWGGFGKAPKFPSSMNLELVLRAAVGGAPGARQVVELSLDAMASGGIYDHLGGGFARYSVDERWLVPHFEKMLYDQALLTRLYTRAAAAFDAERFAQVAAETVEYVLRELRQPEGGFSSAEDADSLDPAGHAHEGEFYVWTPEQLREVLGPELGAAAIEWYGVTDEGNFEGRTILSRLAHRGQYLRPPEIEEARRRLFEARARRPRPGLDDKVLAEWNGLMLAALAEAAATFGRSDWLAAAVQTGEFLVSTLRSPDGRWSRSWQRDGGARHAALAADHAALAEAFVRLAEASGQARWIEHARECADQLLDRFWDVERGGLFTTADDGEQLIVRQKDVLDNATPSANSTAAVALYRLAALTGERRYAHQADQILQLVAEMIPKAAAAFGNALVAADLRRAGLTEIAVVGDRPDLVRAVQSRYLPNAVLAWGEPYDSPLWDQRTDGLAYVCRDYACQAPQDTVEGLLAQLSPAPPAAAPPAAAPPAAAPATPDA